MLMIYSWVDYGYWGCDTEVDYVILGIVAIGNDMAGPIKDARQ